MGRGQVGDVFASPDPWSSPGRFLMDVASSTCFANFHEKFWKHGRTNVAAITVFRGGVVQHSGFYEILIRQLVAKCHTVNSSEKPIPVVCTWDNFLSVTAKIHDHEWGSERRPIQILTGLLYLKAPVLPPQSDKAYAELRLFHLLCINLFVLSSVTRKYHPKVPEFLHLQVQKCFPLACSANCMCFWRDVILSDFTVNFHPGLVARSWKPSNCMLKTLMRRCRQHQIVCKNKTFDSAVFNSARHSCWLGCVCVFNSHGIWREVVTTHILVGVQNSQRTFCNIRALRSRHFVF